MDFFKSAKTYAELIKLGHTLFALPFALSALCLAYLNGHEFGWHKIFWTIVAFAGARSAAMGFNRIVDVRYDALNPRTMERPDRYGENIALRRKNIHRYFNRRLSCLGRR